MKRDTTFKPGLRFKRIALGAHIGLFSIVCLAVLIFGGGGDARAQSEATATPLPLYALPDARINRAVSSGSLAALSDGRTLVAANLISDTVTIAIPSQNALVAEIRVGRDPRGAAVTPDDTRALVTNRGDGTLSVIDVREARLLNTIPLDGLLPYGVVATDTLAYVSLLGSDTIAEVDLQTGQVTAQMPVPPFPSGLALWGSFLYVTHFWTGDLTLIYLPQRRIVQTVSQESPASVSQAVELDITRGLAYMPGSRTFAQNPALTFDSAAFPVVNVFDLRGNAIQRGDRVTLDTADRPVNMPFALALDRFAQRLYVANAGSGDVSVIDLNTGQARAHIPVGSNPRALLLNRDNTLLYVHNALGATITTIQTSDLQVLSTLPISNLTIPVNVLLGAELFYGAGDPRMSHNQSLSCATCHFDGLSDGRVWAGFTGGGRNTPSLFSLPETPPYTWTGAWLELADVEYKIRALQGGTGLIESDLPPPLDVLHNPLEETDLDLLTAYLTTLTQPTPPLAADARTLARGGQVFDQQGCTTCHVGTIGTTLQAYDVGTGGTYDTPSLRWLRWSAPYFHDGSAPTLTDVFTRPGAHQLIGSVPPEDIAALVAYLLSFPS
ncbi:MAG: cytochrome c peroxidase [bacterium]|nr:cytochrome c peroxidase [bacterium]